MRFLFCVVYPTLDMSDTEDEHIFKPRGRHKKDETWNPKGEEHHQVQLQFYKNICLVQIYGKESAY